MSRLVLHNHMWQALDDENHVMLVLLHAHYYVHVLLIPDTYVIIIARCPVFCPANNPAWSGGEAQSRGHRPVWQSHLYHSPTVGSSLWHQLWSIQPGRRYPADQYHREYTLISHTLYPASLQTAYDNVHYRFIYCSH